MNTGTNHECFADNFEDDFGGTTAPRAKMDGNMPSSTAHPEKPTFQEPCKKCRGSGRFISWGGRDLGSCHACKGKGHKLFKRSAADREAGRQANAARKEVKKQKAVDEFAAAHPQEWTWMCQKYNSFDFARSMADAVRQWGDLSEKQMAAVQRCMARDQQRVVEAQARVDNAAQVDVSKISEALAKASQALKRPKLHLGDLVISPAPATGRNAGALYVKTGEIYLGKIMGTNFIRSRDCTDLQEQSLLTAAADPRAAAVAHGKLTGSCACCGRELTNPESVALGIGPICAGRFGW